MDWESGYVVDGGNIADASQMAGEPSINSSFEHFLFSLLPALVLILLSPFYVRHYRLQPIRVLPGLVLWAKLAAAAGLAIVEANTFRVLRRAPDRQPYGTVFVSGVSVVATLSIAFIIYVEHRRALRSSALTGVYLLVAFLYDVARAKSYYSHSSQALTCLAVITAILRLCLLLLLEVSKRGLIQDPEARQNTSEEAVSGFWSRSFLVWLHSTLFLGFRTIISMDDLDALDPEFSSQALSERLELSLRTATPSRYWLNKGLMRAFYAEFCLPIIPRLCIIGFTFYQPLFLQRILIYVGQESSSKLTSLSLIGQSMLIHFGISASRSIFNHMNSRLATMVRGALIPLVINKTLSLPQPEAADSGTITLTSTDIDGITSALPGLHDLWAQTAEIGLGLYLLSTVASEAVPPVIFAIIAIVVISYCLGLILGHYSVDWKESIGKRVASTKKVLSQMKSVKMIGIENAVAARLHSLRVSEATAYRAFRLVASSLNFFAASGLPAMQVATIAQEFFGASFVGTLIPAKVFTALSLVNLTYYPLTQFSLKHFIVRSNMACIDRVQKHLALQEQNAPESLADRPTMPFTGVEKAIHPQTPGRVFEFNDAHLAPSQHAEPVLRNVTCSVNQSQVTAIIGPVASGKTTILRAMLGGATIHRGQVLRKDCRIAYCGQNPWLRNASIRNNIIGPASFDPVRYEVAINTSALGHDLQHLPNRDLTIVGSNGANLSGGQRHRVALARALYSRAPVLLLDDIFGGLDASTAQDIHDRLFGPKGVVRTSNLTVVFTTNSATFVKAANQALILNGSGTVTVQPDPSKLVLSSNFATKCAQNDNVVDPATKIGDFIQERKHRRFPGPSDINEIRQKGDRSLYRYFLGPTSLWKVILLFLGVFTAVLGEYLGDIFVRIWIEADASNVDYFNVYAAIGAAGCLVTFCSLCYALVVIAPKNALKFHEMLLNRVISARLSYLTNADVGSILNHFGHDMTMLLDGLPKSLYSFVYYTFHVLLSTCIILSGMRYSALAVPFFFIILYTIPVYALRTSRQMRHLDIEATEPLYTLAIEMESGVEHIRAFGWRSNFIAEGIHALDESQKPYYYKLAIKRWVELAMNVSNLGLVILLVSIVTITKDRSSQAATALSLQHMFLIEAKLNCAIAYFVNTEIAISCVARLRSFIYSTPVEDGGDRQVALPPRWPTVGNIELSNVSVQYNSTDQAPILSYVSLTIRGGQKIGISGRSGSGKTSLLLTLLRLTEYTGTIVIDGIDISTIPPQQLRSCITTVSQDTVKIDGTVRENLLPYEGQLQDNTITEDILFEALDQTELTNIVERRGGLEAQLSAMQFSDGQMQLLCLARAIVHHTCTQSRLVLLDEPTSHLDVETDNRIQAALRDAFLDCTIILVSHRAESLWDSNVRFEVKNKRVARFFTPKPSPKPLPFHTMLHG